MATYGDAMLQRLKNVVFSISRQENEDSERPREIESQSRSRPMPSTEGEMMTEAMNLGLLHMDIRIRAQNANTPRGTLLAYAYRSRQANRRFNHTSMMLLGKL